MKKRLLSFALLTALILSLALSSASCGQLGGGAAGTVRSAFKNTVSALDSECGKMFDSNKVLKALSDAGKSGYRVTVSLPESFIAETLGTSAIPSKCCISNDVKNNVMSLTTTLSGKPLGVYISDTAIALEFFSKPITLDTKNAMQEVSAWMSANGLGELPVDDTAADALDPSYKGIFGSGDIAKEIDSLRAKWEKLNLIYDFIDAVTCEDLPGEEVKMQSGSVNAFVVEVTMTEEAIRGWYKKAVDKLENGKDFDDIFDLVAVFSPGMSKGEVIAQLREFEKEDFSDIEKIAVRVYIYKNTIIKADAFYEGKQTGSVAFLGDKNMTDLIELCVYSEDGSADTVKLEGNLVPKDDKVNYKVTSGEGSFSLAWDLSASSGKNLTVSGTDMDSFSFFFGLKDKNTVDINVEVPLGETALTVGLLIEPLSGKVEFPKDGQPLSSVSMEDIQNELMELLMDLGLE